MKQLPGDDSLEQQPQLLQLNGVTPLQQMCSSCAGALLVSLFMTPLDVVKIRLQAQDMLYSKKCFLYNNGIMDHLCTRTNGDPIKSAAALHSPEEICNCQWFNRPRYFNGTVDALFKISKVEGVTSLWSGLSPTLVLAVPATVIYLSTYEFMKKAFSERAAGLGLRDADKAVVLTAGALSRTWAVTVVSPLELVRTKMQSQKMPFSMVYEALSHTVRHEGILGLWKGYSATLWRDVPFSAIYWPLYEFFKGLTYSEEHRVPATFVSGALAGKY